MDWLYLISVILNPFQISVWIKYSNSSADKVRYNMQERIRSVANAIYFLCVVMCGQETFTVTLLLQVLF